MKKLLLIAGVLIITLSLWGCQEKPVDTVPISETSTATVTVEEVEDTTTSSATLEVIEPPVATTTGTLEVEEVEDTEATGEEAVKEEALN